MDNAYAMIMAGGNGERFWPASTVLRPKQFVEFFGGKALLRHAVDRLDGLIPPERIFVITAERLVRMSRDVLPMVPAGNFIAEPCRRDTAAAVATACGMAIRNGGLDAVGCILTADHLITPVETFQQTLADAVSMASLTDAVVTMGVVPTRPETGFGYIECGERMETGTKTAFRRVERFVEKPDESTARRYLSEGRHLWNAGMFVWKAQTMRSAFHDYAPDFEDLVDSVASSSNAAETIERLYPGLRAISIDFAVMEHMKKIVVAESAFKWDDVGSWTAIERHFPQDDAGNTVVGHAYLKDTADSIVVNVAGGGDPSVPGESPRAVKSHRIAVAGLEDVVVVCTPTATLVCSKTELKNMKTLMKGALTT